MHSPNIESSEHLATLQLGGLELPLAVVPDSPQLLGTIELRSDIIDALLSASDLRISHGAEQLALALPDMELKGELAEACSLMMEKASVAGRTESRDWFFSTSDEGARLVYSIYASDYVGLLLTCVAGVPHIAISRPAPANATREIVLAAGAERRVLPASAEEDILNGGVMLTAQLPSSDAIMAAFREDRTMSVMTQNGEEPLREKPSTRAIEHFFTACGS